MNSPSTNGPNGRGDRDARGRFARGNRGGPGNPLGAKAGKFRAKLFSSITVKDFAEVVASLLAEAKAGEGWAVKLFLAYAIGEPLPCDILARWAEIEDQLSRSERR
jgi:hypothetical protein